MTRLPTALVRPLVSLLLVLAGTGLAQGDASPAGTWDGAIEIPGSPLGVTVTLVADPTGWQGTIDIPAQGAAGLPLADIAVWGSDVTFAIAGVSGEPTFVGTLSGDTLQGAFSQGGQSFPFSLTRSSAEASAAAPAQSEYQDPAGRYTVQVPGGWSAAEEAGVVSITSPEGGLRVHLLVVPASDPTQIVATSWRLVSEDFDAEPVEVLEPPSQPGIDHTALFNYATDPAMIHQAVTQTVGDDTYVMLIEAEVAEAQSRAAELQMVANSFTITAVE